MFELRPKLSIPPSGCRVRLFKHYGADVEGWLSTVPITLMEAGRQWGLTPLKYHDAGHASVLTLAASPTGEHVLLKAWPDPARCDREVAALRLWSTIPAARVLENERLTVATHMSGIDEERLRSWCLALCLDGLLYYQEVDDARAPVMGQILRELFHGTEASR